MRVLLVNPPIDAVLRHGHVSPVTAYLFYNSAPLGILYIAAVLEEAGVPVGALDAAAERIDVPQSVQRVLDFQTDVLGITTTTVGFESAVWFAEAVKAVRPDLPIVVGGPHVTLLPERTMERTCFDLGVMDEGEYTMLDVVRHFEGLGPALGDIRGLVWRKGSELVQNPPRPQIRDLDELPFPARHLLPPNLYRPIPIDEHALPKYAMITSRGCPHRCVFCQKSGTTYRSHSPQRIVDELEHVVRDYGVRDVAFVDSLFCLSHKRVLSICDEILRRGVKVSWTCSSRVEVVDLPLLQAMKQAGCWRTRFGIESGSDRVLEFISKGINKETIRNAITWADEAGLRPKAFFILGHLPDTRESIEETIAFACSLPLHDITVQINTLLPETPQAEIFEREGERYGRLVSQSTDLASFWEPTFVPWGLEPGDLVRYHRKFYRDFYFRPETIRRHLSTIGTPRDVMKYVQAGSLFAFLFLARKRPTLLSSDEREPEACPPPAAG
ncbi:MAG: cobalamin-dependent protein [Deltaproteobacteria bacterium]|nr:cobalamin-dependent protein [Deltaproteobacteria bacterium]